MYIDPIHAGPVALAHAIARASRPYTPSNVSRHLVSADAEQPRLPFESLRRFVRWWRQLDKEPSSTADPVQLMLLSEPAGRPYATALSGLLLMDLIRRKRAAARQQCPGPRQEILAPVGSEQPGALIGVKRAGERARQ